MFECLLPNKELVDDPHGDDGGLEELGAGAAGDGAGGQLVPGHLHSSPLISWLVTKIGLVHWLSQLSGDVSQLPWSC